MTDTFDGLFSRQSRAHSTLTQDVQTDIENLVSTCMRKELIHAILSGCLGAGLTG